MFKIPSLDDRKNHTEYIIKKFDDSTSKIIKNKKLRGNLLYYFHLFFVSFIFLIILFGPINIYFFISLIIWIFIMLLHLYFGGCIFIRIERELLDDKSWKGIWTYFFNILEYYDYKITDNISNSIFVCASILISFIFFIKMIYFI